MQNKFNRQKSNFYPFYVWVNTIIFSPILLILYSVIVNKDAGQGLEGFAFFILLCVTFGFFWSIPTIIVNAIFYYILIKLQLKKQLIQIVNIGIGVLGIFITFNVLNGFRMSLELILVYSIVWSIFSIILSPIKKLE